MLRSVAIACTVALLATQPAEAWTTKKKYAELVASWPAEGAKPSEETARAVALAYFNKALKDPYSAKYEWGPLTQGTFKGAFERFGAAGWIQDVSVNSKNSYGGYVGLTPFKVVMRSNWIIEVYRFDSRARDWLPTIGNTPIAPPSDLAPPADAESPAEAQPAGHMQWRPKGL